ncbi:MAG TPA: bifunctional phosphopantothenoylcysteine decarboxylase/phosphopantothenate--cysteine ligase CoaBC [Anaerolineae bacterium]|nr:bifunctional phosphopantothenoylcysteine decarboxylase/phosphopantothenate--cysteine ligase CoaBC [Anaerolineae bacterium]
MTNIPLLQNKHIVLGVCGSIAAYKVADLASKLTQAGAQVDCVLTESATKFIGPVTFAAVTGRAALTDADLWRHDAHVPHVQLGESADLMIIAPATANTIAKLAHGQADNLLTVTALAARGPIILVPAMDGGMWSNAATQANVAILRERGFQICGPALGRMASGLIGEGRMVETPEILGFARVVLGERGSLAGKKIVVTAGGTHEAIDPVRFIGNRSSGKQGFAIAQAAIDRGADVTLIVGASALPTPFGATRVEVESAQQMCDAVLAACRAADALIMAAAVADFQAAAQADQKIKKTKDTVELELRLVRTPDILQAVKEQREKTSRPHVTIGFAAETQNLIDNATTKLHGKGLDLIVANDVSASDAGFAVDTNRVTLLDAGGGVEPLPIVSKAQVAEHLLNRLVALLS